MMFIVMSDDDDDDDDDRNNCLCPMKLSPTSFKALPEIERSMELATGSTL